MNQSFNTDKKKGYAKGVAISDKDINSISNQKAKMVKNDFKVSVKNKKAYQNNKSIVNIQSQLQTNKKTIIKKSNSSGFNDIPKENQLNKRNGLLQIDNAIRLIQKNVRIFLNNKNNSLNKMNEMNKKNKIGILKNFNVLDQDDINESPLIEDQTKIKNEKDDSNINNIINECDVPKEENNVEDNKMFCLEPDEQNNNDLIDLKNKFECDDIEDEIKNSYIEESNEPKKTEKFKKKTNVKKRPFTAVLVEKKDNQVISTNIVKEKKKDKDKDKESEREVQQNGIGENIYEKIFKEMDKEKQKNKPKRKEDELNKHIELNKKEEETNIIKDKRLDDIIINQENEPKIIQNEMNFKFTIHNYDDTYEEIPNEKTDHLNNSEKEQLSKPQIMNEEIRKQLTLRKNIDNKENNSSNNSLNSQNKKIFPSSNDVYNRLTNFLNESTSQNYPNSSLQLKQNIDNISKSPEPNINNYINDTQLHSDNIGLTLELKESKKTIESMTKVISDLKSQLKAKDDYHNKVLLSQKNENDHAINTQNTLIESLYTEKKKLEAQISNMQDQLNQSEKSSYKKLQSMRENYELETKKNKDAWFQAEKIRRKIWEEQKIKEMKDLTAKSLEPEIDRIISNHKAEIANLEDKHIKDLKVQKEKLIEDYESKISLIKKKLTKEKEDVIDNEKSITIQKLRNQSQRFECEISEERRRLNSKMQSEITRLESLREKDRQMYEDQISKLEERNSNNIYSNENQYHTKLEQIKRDYDNKLSNEISNIKESLERQNEKIIEQKRNEMEKKFKEMKLDLFKDRDKQIDIVIEKLGEETMVERKKHLNECEKKANEKNLALIEENGEMRKKINDLNEKLQFEIKKRINLEENIEIISKKLKDKENELDKKEKKLKDISRNYNDVNEKLMGLTRDFNKEKVHLEIEMKSHTQKGDAEIALLNNKLRNTQKLYEQQKEEMEKMHRKEIEEIEIKIKKGFKRKDEIIQKLQEEIELKEITIQKYKEMINKQREELVGKI